MAAPPVLVVTVLALVLAERVAELALDRRHVAWLRARGAAFETRDGFGLILAGQVALFALLPLEALAAAWARAGWWTWLALAAALLAQALRYWAIATLRERWSIRVVTLPGAARVTSGPYRWLAHPNYVAVALETLTLPLAFRAWGTLLLAGVVMGLALARRIRIEERALARAEAARGVEPSPPPVLTLREKRSGE